jgi:hypothetical protein
MTHPGARDYLRTSVRRMVHDWGYRYLKMDGLTSGVGVRHIYVNDAFRDDGLGDAVFHDPGKSNIEAFRDGLKVIREAAGLQTYLLGCCVAQNMRSYGGAMGLVDAMRIGPDNQPDWPGLLVGPRHGTRHYHLHGRVWHNDPDCLYARPSLPLNQVRLLASWVTLSGQLSISSEAFAQLPPERLDLLRRTMPAHGQPARPVDLFDNELPRIWLVSTRGTAPRRDVVGLFNWKETEAAFDEPLERIGIPAEGEQVAFDYWGNALIGPFKGRLQQRVAGRSCLVLAVRSLTAAPQLLSTSRHITQGMVDVVQEKWTAQRRELSGISRVVGGDSYELRIVLLSTKGEWKPAAVEVSAEDRTAGVTAVMKEERGLLRVTLQSGQSREVSWKVRFE